MLTYWSQVNDEQRRTNVEKIQRASLRLDRLVRDLLHISRMDASAIRLNLGQQALAPLLEQSTEDLQIRYTGQVVLIDPAIIEARVWGDADRLRQVAGNLLDNAAKYSPEGSPIAVLWQEQEGYGTISFRDAGHGIRPEDEPLLFRRFGKLDSRIRAGHIGTGLGLYICRQFVHAMGGQIWHERPPDDLGGAIFCVRLPSVCGSRSPRGLALSSTAVPLLGHRQSPRARRALQGSVAHARRDYPANRHRQGQRDDGQRIVRGEPVGDHQQRISPLALERLAHLLIAGERRRRPFRQLSLHPITPYPGHDPLLPLLRGEQIQRGEDLNRLLPSPLEDRLPPGQARPLSLLLAHLPPLAAICRERPAHIYSQYSPTVRSIRSQGTSGVHEICAR